MTPATLYPKKSSRQKSPHIRMANDRKFLRIWVDRQHQISSAASVLHTRPLWRPKTLPSTSGDAPLHAHDGKSLKLLDRSLDHLERKHTCNHQLQESLDEACKDFCCGKAGIGTCTRSSSTHSNEFTHHTSKTIVQPDSFSPHGFSHGPTRFQTATANRDCY